MSGETSVRWLILCLVAAIGCGGTSCTEAGVGHPPKRAPAKPPPPVPKPAPDRSLAHHRHAVPSTLRIVNERPDSIVLVVSHGGHEPFGIEPREGEPAFTLGGSGAVLAGPSCTCRCGYRCLVCEPPRYREVSVGPGEHFEFAWSGRVRVWRQLARGGCFEPYAPPPGPRKFKACLGNPTAEDRDCVFVEVELPADLVELRFGE